MWLDEEVLIPPDIHEAGWGSLTSCYTKGWRKMIMYPVAGWGGSHASCYTWGWMMRFSSTLVNVNAHTWIHIIHWTLVNDNASGGWMRRLSNLLLVHDDGEWAAGEPKCRESVWSVNATTTHIEPNHRSVNANRTYQWSVNASQTNQRSVNASHQPEGAYQMTVET